MKKVLSFSISELILKEKINNLIVTGAPFSMLHNGTLIKDQNEDLRNMATRKIEHSS